MDAPPLQTPAGLAATGSRLRQLVEALQTTELTRRVGTVRRLRGLAIESDGPVCRIGELCAIGATETLNDRAIRPGAPGSGGPVTREPLLAEVVAVSAEHVTLMPFGNVQGLAAGSTVVALGEQPQIAAGDALLGRVIDGFGRPLDSRPSPSTHEAAPLRSPPGNPMLRPPIDSVIETGVRSIDGLLTLGRGQRVGIFAGSGVGKSTLLGMIAKHVTADVNVIALIGERGREVREFVEKQLGAGGLARSVVVVASADQPALARIRAAHAALAIAEHFRASGRHVLLMMDSITRLAMARREVGLSAGEPPTARGYTPSVFAELPELCERCGTGPSGGSITALLTVLVEGDDFNEPVADALRAILDGHIVLSRQLAHQGQYPAIDLLKSASRLLPSLTSKEERLVIHEALGVLALLERNRQMVELGAYESGSNPELDAALATHGLLKEWLVQHDGGCSRADAMAQLHRWHLAMQAARPTPDGAPGTGGTQVQASPDRHDAKAVPRASAAGSAAKKGPRRAAPAATIPGRSAR